MRCSAFIDADGNYIAERFVSLFVVNAKRKWRDVPETTIDKLARFDGKYLPHSEPWVDCVVLNILRCITEDFSGKTVEDAMRGLMHTQSGFIICSALYVFGVRRFA
jgi:hypothetical protein